MELLLLSSSRTPAGYLTDYLAEIREFAGGTCRAVFVPFAAVTVPWPEYAARVQKAIGFSLGTVNGPEDLAEADVVIVGGGNTFQLLRECRTRGLLEAIRSRVVRNNMKYLGWSAGANLACPTIRTTNDMPIVDPGGLDALGLIPFQVNPHYLNVSLPGHHGETRDERLAEFVAKNPNLPVMALPEGDWLRGTGRTIELRGPHPARWFQAGKDPEAVRAGTWKLVATSNGPYEKDSQDPRTR